MKQIILERNVGYAVWENLIYLILFLVGLFIGTTFFSTGNLATFLSFLSGILLLLSFVHINIKKGLLIDKNLYLGYFLFGQLVLKKQVENAGLNKFTVIDKKYRQHYVGSKRFRKWEYSINAYELFFFDENGEIRNEIIKCTKRENSERAKGFLLANTQLNFKSLS